LLFCGGPGAPAGVEGVGSAWAPLGGGALCVSAGGGVELELSAGAGGSFAGGAVAGGGAVDSGGGVDDCSGGGVEDDCSGGGVDAAAGGSAGGAASSACARPANSNNASKSSVTANNMRSPSFAEATTTGTAPSATTDHNAAADVPRRQLCSPGCIAPTLEMTSRGEHGSPPDVIALHDWCLATSPCCGRSNR
jgi:hypothetical protein